MPTPAETARVAPAEPAAAPAEPPPAVPPPVEPLRVEPPPAAAAAPPPVAAAALGPVAKSRLRRLVTVGGTLLILFVLWETFTFFVAYTDDAYVRSDLVAVASEVTGPIIAVHVVDNQTVKKGDKLVSIDPVPFQLDVNQRQAQIDEAACIAQGGAGTAFHGEGGPCRRHLDVTPMPSSSRRGLPCWRRATTRRAPNSTATTTSCGAPRRR